MGSWQQNLRVDLCRGWVCQPWVGGWGTVTEKMGLGEPLLKYRGEKGGLCQVRASFWY